MKELAAGLHRTGAIMASLVAVQHIAFALAGGVHPDSTIAWLLVGATAIAAMVAWIASRRWSALALVGVALLWVPFLVTYPAAGLSIGGWSYLLLALLASVTLVTAVVLQARPARPSPA